MTVARTTFVIRQLSDREADRIVASIHELERSGHEVADVRHEGHVWRVYAYDRRFHDAQRGSITFRRRISD